MLRAVQARLHALLPVATQLERARTLSRAGRAAEAVAIWARLAEAGVTRAQANLGASYATGAGIPVNLPAAGRWLLMAAQGGSTLAQRNLATLLLPDDPAAAAAWFLRAAEGGDPESQDHLSGMLLAGTGGRQDAAEARRWAHAAATAGIAAAAARLGLMCHDAVGGPRDPAQAAQWWRAAANAGDPDSAARLGAAVHLGQGLPADQVEAMAWLLVASGRRSALVRPFFTRVSEGLTAAQAAAAQDRASEFGWVAE